MVGESIWLLELADDVDHAAAEERSSPSLDTQQLPAPDRHLAVRLRSHGVLQEDVGPFRLRSELPHDSASALRSVVEVVSVEVRLFLAPEGPLAADAPEVERVVAEDAHGALVERKIWSANSLWREAVLEPPLGFLPFERILQGFFEIIRALCLKLRPKLSM